MKSMTGFGKSTLHNQHYQMVIEMKGVNHRFLDCTFRLDREYSEYEFELRQLVKEAVGRGRIEVTINIQDEREDTKKLMVNWSLLDSLIAAVDEAKTQRYQNETLDISQILTGLHSNRDYFEVVEDKPVDESLSTLLHDSFQTALRRFNTSRALEGDKIQQVISNYLTDFSSALHQLSQQSDAIEKDYQNKLSQKMKRLLGSEVEEARLLTEVAILIERGDIHEELDRLQIHLENMRVLINQSGPQGRELDFLIQEMNREVNTIGSKSSAIELKNGVVQLKTILEKIREQVQNIE